MIVPAIVVMMTPITMAVMPPTVVVIAMLVRDHAVKDIPNGAIAVVFMRKGGSAHQHYAVDDNRNIFHHFSISFYVLLFNQDETFDVPTLIA